MVGIMSTFIGTYLLTVHINGTVHRKMSTFTHPHNLKPVSDSDQFNQVLLVPLPLQSFCESHTKLLYKEQTEM